MKTFKRKTCIGCQYLINYFPDSHEMECDKGKFYVAGCIEEWAFKMLLKQCPLDNKKNKGGG